ncbi:hypothetical protein LG200_04700 [Methylobacillus caricis]|uniref:efflux RND transporter periplasmic adaptor subunit n=1 Tax=Methylobacillus caricis TaxID=1971611 RepID=UPI001CFFF440|nr:hypothetical protein [Methylobacillus caricis]MCB5187305.1 hypothetical protein [Methylobacillus caricis]
MNKKTTAVIIIQACIIVVLLWLLVLFSKDEFEELNREEEIESPMRVHTGNGVTTVTLTAETQQQSDIQTTVLSQTKHTQTFKALGTVISIDSLIELRTRYMAALGDVAIAQAAFVNSQSDYQRLAQLNKDDRNISDRMVIAAEAVYKADQAKLAAAETNVSNLKYTMRQQWGEVLSQQATERTPSEQMKQLLDYKHVLLRVTMPFERPEPRPGEQLHVSPIGSGLTPITAYFVAISPQADPTLQGKTYFYSANSTNLRAGMRLSTQSLETSSTASGVVVPQNAIVWYGGKGWVYRKADAEHFIREPVSTEIESGNGWFNQKGPAAGSAIVTNGAQLLLSEEFKYQIKNENDD